MQPVGRRLAGAAVDALLDGLLDAESQGRWQADSASEARRLDLLPQTAPRPWDELMHHPAYLRAPELIPEPWPRPPCPTRSRWRLRAR